MSDQWLRYKNIPGIENVKHLSTNLAVPTGRVLSLAEFICLNLVAIQQWFKRSGSQR